MIELQRFEKSDFERLIGWIPDERFLIQWAGPLFRWPLDIEQLQTYLGDSEGEQPKRYIFKAVDSVDGAVVGHIEIRLHGHETPTGVLSRVLIGETKHRDNGYGQQMVQLAVEYGFNRLSLDQIDLAVLDFNEAAIHCYQKIGFEPYEIKESIVPCDGERLNVVMMRLKKDHCNS